MKNSVLVIGGGIGGIEASLDLANAGYTVYLLEESPCIGGNMARLDKTFPTNDCALCILSPKLVEVARCPQINIITLAEILSVSGCVGNFSVVIKRYPRYVEENRCIGCGICTQKCPTKIKPSEFDAGLRKRSAIYIPYPQAVPNIATIDPSCCVYILKGRCKVCQKVCPTSAINFSQQVSTLTLNVGAIIVAAGFEQFNGSIKGEYGWGRYSNVVTSLEFERILSASGPFGGDIKRLSDNKRPESIAFIQCVGSRDTTINADYCSSICCTAAIKQAIIAKEKLHNNLKITIFGIDIRTFGKGCEEYYILAKERYKINFIYSKVAEIAEVKDTNRLILYYEAEEGRQQQEEYDMVVLSLGFKVKEKARELAERMMIRLNEYNFCLGDRLRPLETSRPGVYICGSFQEPKDIPQTVIQASACTAKIKEILKLTQDERIQLKLDYQEKYNTSVMPLRIGVFVCHCGSNIASIVNVKDVVDYVKELPNVVFAQDNLYTCSKDSQERIKEIIKEYNLTRVVVGACTPRTHEALFRQTLAEAGLNPYLFEMANIREQCSWVHQKDPILATEKAKQLLRMACAKAAKLQPLYKTTTTLIPKALVIGGGIAGLVAALSIAKQGFFVDLVEKEAELGGNLRHLYYTLENDGIQDYLKGIIKQVQNNELIKLHLKTQITNIVGFVGSFKSFLKTDEENTFSIEHGVIIVATGAREYKPLEYLYGKDERILTQRELEREVVENPIKIADLKYVVMIQCVGSRNVKHNYCSRYCCSAAIKNVIKLKKINPKIEIYVLFRDMRTYGFRELYYKIARQLGVIFIRYKELQEPEVKIRDGVLEVKVFCHILQRYLLLNPDLLVLSSAIIPDDDNQRLSQLLKIPLTQNGFFQEAHIKLQPVQTTVDGVFLAGLCHGPQNLDECISSAYAAAAKATNVLAKTHIETEAQICHVDVSRCRGCGLCRDICPYMAIELEVDERSQRKVAKVNKVVCRGCGACVATCRMGALDLYGFSQQQLYATMIQV